MLILLYGPDTWRSREKLAALKAKYLAEVPHAAYNLVCVNARTASADALSQALSTPPLLARRRMVVIEYFLAIHHKKILELLYALATKGKDGNIVILWEEALPDTHDAVFEALTKTAYAQEFNVFTPCALGAWIEHTCTQQNLTISPQAQKMLTERVGSDLWRMTGELEKLCAYSHAQNVTTITPAAVSLLVAPTLPEEQMFPLLNALAIRNSALALSLLNEHLEAGAGEIATASLMMGLFRNLIQLKAYQEEHPQANHADIAKHLRLHPYVVQKSLPRLRSFSHKELAHIFKQLVRADLSLKSIRVVKPRVFLDLILARLNFA